MRKYRAEQIMKWLEIRDGWKVRRWQRKVLKELFLDSFLKDRKDEV